MIVKNGIARSRIVRDAEGQTVVKQILNNNKASMRALSKFINVRDEMFAVIKQKIKTEVCGLTKKSNKILNTANRDLLEYDSKKLLSFLKDKAPYLFDILKCVVKEEHFISTAASVLMYGHSQRLSQLQYIVGLSLDRCGLTKEVRHYLLSNDQKF